MAATFCNSLTVTPRCAPLISTSVASAIIWKMPGVVLPSMPFFDSSCNPSGTFISPTRWTLVESVIIDTAVEAEICVRSL